MYRMYAQMQRARLNLGIRRRLAPLLGNNRRRIELLNALLFSLPGTPGLYYGDEIGLGENIYLGDRNGVRTPMQWSSDKNAGFSRANPQSLYLPIILDPEYHYEAVNVEAQLANPHSLLWWMRRLLALRKRWRALGEGKCEFLQPENRKILSYVLRYDQENILVVANLSRFSQPVELDLAAFRHYVPIELFGRTEFPAITDKPYLLTLDPHGFFWFSLEPKVAHVGTLLVPAEASPPAPIQVENSWLELLSEGNRGPLETVLPGYLRGQSWFRGKPQSVKLALIKDVIPFPSGDGCAGVLTLVQVDYTQSESEIYTLALAYATGGAAYQIRERWPQLVVCDIQSRQTSESGVLFDAIASPAFCREWLHHLWHRKSLKGDHGQAEPVRTPALHQLWDWATPVDAQPGMVGRKNSTVFFGDKLVLKLLRRIEPGTNPELELSACLTSQGFHNSPVLAGTFEYVTTDNLRFGLAAFSGFVHGASDARKFTIDSLGRYFDRAITWVAQGREAAMPPRGSTRLMVYDLPTEVMKNIGTYVESARLLGTRTAELHLALASAGEDKDLVPEPFTLHYQRGLFQTMRSSAVQAIRVLRTRLGTFPEPARALAEKVAALEGAVVQVFRALLGPPLAAKRIRVHGDCRLEEVLWTGKDFVFIDLEGDLNLALSERRLKRSPFHDVARMLRSLHYAAIDGVHRHFEQGSIPDENLPKFDRWVGYWAGWVSVAFLRAYMQRVEPGGLLPAAEPQLHAMLRAYLLHRVVGELVDELSAREGRPEVPLQSILFLVS